MSRSPDPATEMWRNGNRQQALATVFRTERLAVYAIARGIVGVDAAADVAQEALASVWSHPDRFDPDKGTLARYLRMVARSIAIDHLRSKVSRQARETRSTARADIADVDNSSDQALDLDIRRRVGTALANLPADERILIIQAFYGNRTYRTLAQLHDLPEGTVKSRIRRGLIRLRHDLAIDQPG